MNQVEIQTINLPKEWKVHWNNLTVLEPDNDWPIDDAFLHFFEDISYFTYEEYLMDIGYYGEYLSNREGHFGIFIAKGDFIEGELYECVHTRSLKVVVDIIEKYGDMIVSGEINKLTAMKFSNGDNPEYSALESYENANHGLKKK